MLYVNFHLGDWISSTRILSATERGVYMDLLTQYYVNERPITKEECTRIARAYAPAEQDAMQYVLHTFFIEEDGAYRHVRCDREIKAVSGISEKKKKAAQARWDKKKAGEHAKECTSDAEAMQKECTCNAGAMQPNTQYPIPNTQIKVESTDVLSTQAQAPASTPARRRKTSGVSSVEKPDEIPEQVWSDWLQIRKAKRLPLTKTAWDAMLVEAEKVGFTPAEAVKHAVERGWAGFKASWYENDRSQDKAEAPQHEPGFGWL